MTAAAASLFRGRGLAGVRSTKGLFFILTLLCLVRLASSLIDKNKLENLKTCFKEAQRSMDEWKAERAMSSELMSKCESFKEKIAESDLKMEKAEHELGQMKKLIQFLEEHQAEL